MAFDAKPESWIADWSEDGTDVTFPLLSLSQDLTAGEADATAGDWRACLFSILDHTYGYYYGLATADKPTKLTISKSSSMNNDGTYSTVYTARFTTDVGSQDVSAEPT